VKINSKLAMGESLVDGLSGDQRLFVAFAQAGRRKSGEGRLREMRPSDPTAGSEFCVNGVVRRVDARAWRPAHAVALRAFAAAR
jgi:putative endopeptidase